MLTEDYIVRMIQDMGHMVARVLGRDISFEGTQRLPQREQTGEPLPLLEELKRLADDGKVNEAENRLFEELDFSDPSQLPIVLGFYEHLNQFADGELESWGYSREEIWEGLRDCGEQFGVDTQLLDAFSWEKATNRKDTQDDKSAFFRH